MATLATTVKPGSRGKARPAAGTTAHLPEDVFFLSVRELGARIRAKTLRITDLVAGSLDRLERLGPKYNAVVTLMRDSAMREARAAEASLAAGHDLGPLHGIPYGVKDLLATRGVPTTWGAAPYRDQVFDYDATAVRKLREAGAVLVAKLAMVELAGGMGYNHADASFTGPGLTPWNTKFWSGGSSSGPGAAVAAGLVPFALGSETSGSILTPSAYSGTTGLRPTYGLVSRHGALLDARQGGPHGPQRRRLRAGALGDRRPRPRGPVLLRQAFRMDPDPATHAQAANRSSQGLRGKSPAAGPRELRGGAGQAGRRGHGDARRGMARPAVGARGGGHRHRRGRERLSRSARVRRRFEAPLSRGPDRRLLRTAVAGRGLSARDAHAPPA